MARLNCLATGGCEVAARIELEDLVSLPENYAVVLDESGTKVAFGSDRSGRMQLYVQELSAGAEVTQIGDGLLPATLMTPLVWSRDGATIVFGRDQDGDEQHNLFSVDLASGGVRQLTSSPGQDFPGPFAPDGRELIVVSSRAGQLNLYLLNLDSLEVRQLTDFPNPVSAVDWSVDGRFIYLTGSQSKNARNEDVYRVGRDGSGLTCLYSSGDGNRDWARAISRDGRWLAFSTDRSGVSQPGVIDLTTAEVRFLGDEASDEGPVGFTLDSRRLLTTVAAGTSTRLIEIDLDTAARTVLDTPPGLAWPHGYAASGEVVIEHSDTTHRFRLMAVNRTGLRVLIDARYGPLAGHRFVPGSPVSFASGDLTVHGILYKPPRRQGQRLPAVVWVHGGPTGNDFEMFDPAVQIICDRGFAVLQVNYRGSTGYGRAFKDLNLGDIGCGDAADVAAGNAFLRQDPDIDPDAILCAGGSYGGYMTYRQLTHYPELWAGGLAIVGITDWARLYDDSMESYKSYLKMLFKGSPQEVPDRYRQASPIHEVAQVRVPVVMAQGENDPRCPLSQAESFRDRLLELGKVEGKDFVYHRLGAQGHYSAEIGQKMQLFRILDEFLARFSA